MGVIDIHKKFAPLFQNKKGIRYYVVTGGRFSSKSYSVSFAACRLTSELNHRILYSRYTLVSAKDSIIPEFREKLDILGHTPYYDISIDRIVSKFNQSKIVFKGIKTSSGNQTAKLKSLKDFSCFILDEADEENDEVSFDKINLSIRSSDVQNMVILILNPASKAHWIYKRFFEDTGVQPGFNGVHDNVCYIHTTYLDCINYVPEDYLNEINRLKLTNPDKYNHIIMGGWLDKADGVIFDDWEYGPFDNSLPYGYGMDFGFFPDPDTMIRCGVDRKNHRLYVKAEIYEYKQPTSLLKDRVRSLAGDKLVIADSAEPRLISDIKATGVNIQAVQKGAGSVLEGIRLMRDFKIIVDPESTVIGKELNNYCEKGGVPIDSYNHSIDAISYYLRTVVKPGPIRKGHRILK